MHRVVAGIVLVTEAQQTERALTAFIILLLVVAALLALLTLWYWRHTDPRRRVHEVAVEARQRHFDQDYQFELDQRYENQLIDLNDPYQNAGRSPYR